MARSTFVYTTYIRTTPDKLWEALTSPALTEHYWFGMRMEADWKRRSPWRLLFPDGRVADVGEIVEADRPRRIVLDWCNEWKPQLKAEGRSTCTLSIEPIDDAVKLTVAHEMDRSRSALIDAVSWGWPRVLSNLKSLLETGEVAFAETV